MPSSPRRSVLANSTPCAPGAPPLTARGAEGARADRDDRWYRGPIVRGSPVFPLVPRGAGPRRRGDARSTFSATRFLVLGASCALLAGGCGGGSKQDAGEPKINVRMNVTLASFPPLQAISRPTTLTLRVRNTGTQVAPNVAVTLDSLNYASNYPELSAAQRPVWVINRGPGEVPVRPAQSQAISPPGGGVTNYVNTWALGPLAPGHARTFNWRVVPVKAGKHTVHFTVAAGLAGNAKAVSASGGPVNGQFVVFIAGAPPPTQVDPNTGKVVPGTYPPAP